MEIRIRISARDLAIMHEHDKQIPYPPAHEFLAQRMRETKSRLIFDMAADLRKAGVPRSVWQVKDFEQQKGVCHGKSSL